MIALEEKSTTEMRCERNVVVLFGGKMIINAVVVVVVLEERKLKFEDENDYEHEI